MEYNSKNRSIRNRLFAIFGILPVVFLIEIGGFMGGKWKPEYGNNRKTKTYTSSEVKYRYNKKHYDNISFPVPIGSKDRIKSHAESQGKSVAEYLRGLIIADDPSLIVYLNNEDNRGGGQSQ